MVIRTQGSCVLPPHSHNNLHGEHPALGDRHAVCQHGPDPEFAANLKCECFAPALEGLPTELRRCPAMI